MTNLEIIKKYSARLWDQKDLEAVNEYFAPNAKIHSPLNTKEGSDTMLEICEKWLNAFPDLLIKFEDYIADGDKVVSRWRATGTHLGGFFDTQPTHNEISYSGITIYQLKDGKVVEYWALVDMHAILSQIGHCQHVSEVVE